MLAVTDIPAPTFQSTLPVKGATPRHFVNQIVKVVSIHAPREGSDLQGIDTQPTRAVSIHAPREGSDIAAHIAAVFLWSFNPRSP